MPDDRWRDTYDAWKLQSPYDDEPWQGRDDEELNESCPTCAGSGLVHPLSCPPDHFCATYDACPHCDGSGYLW